MLHSLVKVKKNVKFGVLQLERSVADIGPVETTAELSSSYISISSNQISRFIVALTFNKKQIDVFIAFTNKEIDKYVTRVF